ncbi:hypothetical protein [Eoetvoesiella caeni]
MWEPDILDRQFDVAAPNIAWVTDIIYIRTPKGWLYLAVVVSMFVRQAVGWSMIDRLHFFSSCFESSNSMWTVSDLATYR